MEKITIAWIALSFFTGFTIYLFPKISRELALGTALLSLVYGIKIFSQPSTLNIRLLDRFGVDLLVDQTSAFFVLTNALVTIAVIFYCWQTGKKAFFYMQLIILHGSVNATFICVDFISLYVALEVISIAAFLLISYPRTDKSIWVGLRYMFVSNVAMLFYLVGAILVYKANKSFNFEGLINAPLEAIALIFIGLLVKGGIFISGMWLPLTHAESETPVSAMLSGVVVKAGVFPLIRCAMILAEIEPAVRILGVATTLLGVSYAIWERDTKRTLAFSTVSQLGFIMAAPSAGGFYALTHGLAKSALFLTAGSLPSRNFEELKTRRISTSFWIVLAIASLSISGAPLLSGFSAKALSGKDFFPWQAILMNLATVGTAITYAKFIFLPHQKSKSVAKSAEADNQKKIEPNYWWAVLPLCGGLILGNGFNYQEAYVLSSLIKSLVILAIGYIAYFLVVKSLSVSLPKGIEKFDNLIGMMSFTLIFIFLIIWARISALA
ncbi:MAG: cation:proton antiporter [Cyanobacteria bacterium P01_G01_bin.19]